MLKANPFHWLLEEDPENPSVRYFALHDLLELPESDAEVRAARSAIMHSGSAPVILAAQEPSGEWVKAGSGYSPKYRGTVWSLLILAELGADPQDPRVRKGCEYLLEHSIASNGAFSAYQGLIPSGAIHCLNGNLLFALERLGFGSDSRLQTVIDWLARAILGEQPIQFYTWGTTGPNFACGINLSQPCGWGANKAIRGLLEVPRQERTPLMERALQVGAEFLLSHNPIEADYPYTQRVSSTWFKLGFPLSYWSDVLETVANLVDLGFGADPRLQPALDWILARQDDQGRWKLGNSLNGKMWVDIEAKGKPSKWITLRALRVLKRAGLYVAAG
ncbi:MAG: nitrogen fixation protein NifH [Omnitrophica WOR_2 bacterium]